MLLMHAEELEDHKVSASALGLGFRFWCRGIGHWDKLPFLYPHIAASKFSSLPKV